MNGGEIIANVLQKHGVQFMFTLCGGHISPIYVEAEKLGIRIIDTRHEATAVFAADAVARLTGIPGVAAVTAGPGLTNTITAVKNAYMAQSPLVLLGGGAATILKGRGSLQDIDQISLMKPNVKKVFRITKVKNIASTLEKAFAIAIDGIPGPVFVECPIDTLYEEKLVRSWYGAKSKENKPRNLQEKLIQWYVERHAAKLFSGNSNIEFNLPLPGYYPKHSGSDITRVTNKLRRYKKPLMIVGSGAIKNPEMAGQLAEAIISLGIPVYLTGMARGLLGKNELLQARHKRKEAIKEADFIILAGVPNDFRLDYGSHIGSRPFVSVNRSKEDLYKNKRPTIAICADPQEFIIDLAVQFTGDYSLWKGTLNERDRQNEISIAKQAEEKTGYINPMKLFFEMDRLMGDNTILVADGGDFVATASYILKPRAPLSWLDPGVFGTLGVGAGFALGAKLVFPEKNVWIIYGDGSAGYSLMEYDTYVRHNLPINSVIGNNGAWEQIARDQVEFLESECAVGLEHSDYHKIADAFGADGIRVDTIEQFAEAIAKCNNGKPHIINAIIGSTNFRKGSISM
jgi:thiamine pyrophosphate-dependent acetolactate synthase large subunit-like protein